MMGFVQRTDLRKMNLLIAVLYQCILYATAGELSCEIPVVVSNHPNLEHVAAQFGVPFRWLPLDRTQGGKPAQEAALEEVLRGLDIDTIVLARYMQVCTVLSPKWTQ